MKKSSLFAAALVVGIAFGATRAAKADEKQKAETMRATTANDLAILFIYLLLFGDLLFCFLISPCDEKQWDITKSYIGACKNLGPIVCVW